LKALAAGVVAAVVLPVLALGAGVVLLGGASASTATTSALGAGVLVDQLGWSPVLADALARGVAGAGAWVPGCTPRIALVAAVVETESAGGRGRHISATGDTDPRVIGPALDGTTPGTAVVPDTDGGRWDGDARWDHAVGIAQFLPATWAASGLDASGDGVADPHNVYDAVASQVAKLCRDGSGLHTEADERRALFAYNAAGWYVDQVLATAADIQARLDQAGPGAASGPTVERPGGGTVELATVGGITVARPVAGRLEALLGAAAADGIDLGGSGWRSTQSQIDLRRTNGCPDVYQAPPESCRVPTAIPGTSMHEIGEAVDFTVGGSTITSGSPAFGWRPTPPASGSSTSRASPGTGRPTAGSGQVTTGRPRPLPRSVAPRPSPDVAAIPRLHARVTPGGSPARNGGQHQWAGTAPGRSITASDSPTKEEDQCHSEPHLGPTPTRTAPRTWPASAAAWAPPRPTWSCCGC